MATAFEQLRQILKRYESCYRELYDLQLKEREYLTNLQIDELDANNNRKETLAVTIRSLEESRLRICIQIAELADIDPGEVTLAFLAETCEPEQREDFISVAKSFQVLAKELDLVTQTNRKLVQSSLNTTRNLERVLKKLVTDQPTYLPSGEMDSGNRNSSLVHRTL